MNQMKLFWLLPFEVSLTPPSEITEVAITDPSFVSIISWEERISG